MSGRNGRCDREDASFLPTKIQQSTGNKMSKPLVSAAALKLEALTSCSICVGAILVAFRWHALAGVGDILGPVNLGCAATVSMIHFGR